MKMSQQENSTEGTGIIVVDVQADFTELRSGSLAVPGTDAEYISEVDAATLEYIKHGYLIYLTQDWHPADHVSFFTNNPGTKPLQVIEIEGRPQIMWPPHCVQDTPGAEILIDSAGPVKTVRKGMNVQFDSYSGFSDDGGARTGLDDMLQKDGIQKLMIYGLATDYCVKATAMDARKAGYQVEVILDLCRGVNPETTKSAIREMKEIGVVLGPKASQ